MTVRVILAPTFELATGVTPPPAVTIEAEYGSRVLEGTQFTAAHHQPMGKYSHKESPSPCCNGLIPYVEGGTILMSHFDLDAMGGALRAVLPPHAPLAQELFGEGTMNFWRLAEYVDVHGVHLLKDAVTKRVVPRPELVDQTVRGLRAFWAWQRHVAPTPQDDAMDVTDLVMEGADVLMRIAQGDPDLLAMGDAFYEGQLRLNKESFVSLEESVLVRRSENPDACTMFATPGEGVLMPLMVVHNPMTGKLWLGAARRLAGFDVAKLAHNLWGVVPEEGNYMYATSPAGQTMNEDDIVLASMGLHYEWHQTVEMNASHRENCKNPQCTAPAHEGYDRTAPVTDPMPCC